MKKLIDMMHFSTLSTVKSTSILSSLVGSQVEMSMVAGFTAELTRSICGPRNHLVGSHGLLFPSTLFF
jgi:hypothetical protein